MTDLDLKAIEARVERARSAESWDDWNLERDALTDSVGDVSALTAEVRRLRGELTEQGDRLRETLAKRDELRERLEYAENLIADTAGQLRDANNVWQPPVHDDSEVPL